MIVLLGLAGNAAAVSPMPGEEMLGLQTENVCAIHIVYIPAKGVLREEATSTLVFDASTSKKDVLEKVTRYISEKLTEGPASEFRVECKFARQ